MYNRIAGVVVAIICCDHVCCWYCLVILESVVSLLRQLLLWVMYCIEIGLVIFHPHVLCCIMLI